MELLGAAGGEERGADAKQAALQSNKGSGRGCPDHPAGREEAGGQRGSTATSPGSLRHPGARRWGPSPSAGVQRQSRAPGAAAPRLRRPPPARLHRGARHRPCHPPATGRDPPAQPDRGAFLVPPAFVFYLVLLFSPLWSFVPACPLFRRLWFLVPLMLCHSLHLGALLSARIFKLAVVFSPRSVLGIFILSPASSTPRVTWARPGLSSNPHLSCFGAWISLPLCPFLRDSQRFFFSSPHRGK